MGAYNLTSMMRQERSMKFQGVEVKGLTRFLVFLLFLLISTVLVYFLVNKFSRDLSIPIACIYCILAVIIFVTLQSFDVNEHMYKIIDWLLPKHINLIYYQDDIHITRKQIERGRGEVVVYKTSRKRR